ncbi:hypothetical protein CHUAL_009810 [Chamberlinius hualienensis]
MSKTAAVFALLSILNLWNFINCNVTSSSTGTSAGTTQTVVSIPSPPANTTVTNACLHCMCDASSHCQPLSCHLVRPGQYYCGPYLISWAYWSDAGKPQDVENDPYAFEKCLINKECAEQTIRNYMDRYARDCNNDGQINCEDFAKIHKSGPFGCNASWIEETNYFKTLKTCIIQIAP